LARTLRSQGEKRLGSFFRLRAKLDNFSELLFWSPPAWFPSIRSSLSIDSGLPCITVRSTPAVVFSGPAQRSLMLWPARSPSRLATLYIESSDSFVASAAASIATGWSESVPGRELHPLKSSAFSRRTVKPTTNRTLQAWFLLWAYRPNLQTKDWCPAVFD
jgi:hypothetical protein